MSHGNLQGTCHWDLYELWGPARYLSLRPVWTMGPCRTDTHVQALHLWFCRWTMMVALYHFVCFHSFIAEYDDNQDFIPRWIFSITAMSRQINQLTNQPDPLSALLQYTGFSQSSQLLGGQDIISAFTKPDSSSAHSQNPTLYPHIDPGEYNPQPEIYFYNSQLISPPPTHHFPAVKFPHFLKRNVSAILIFSTPATYQHTSLSFASWW